MMQFGLIGIGAGAAAALLFASVTSGSWFSVILFYLAPLPIMIAGLGWSHWAALVGALSGALAVGVIFGGVFFFAFLAGAGIPAWWLGYLAMLARPVGGNGGAPTLEWYPPGRLVVWAAALAALIVVVAIPNFGTDAESFRAGLNDALTRMLRADTGADAGAPLTLPGVANADRLIVFLVAAIPPAAAVLATITNTVNLWLAARIVNFSGRLKRPWPDLSAMTFPKMLAGALAVAVVITFGVPDSFIGIMASVLSASLLMAYAVLGFAVLHAGSRGLNSRAFVLGGSYAAVMVFGWPVLAFCLLGLIESVFDLRARIARRRGPPSPPSNPNL
ncbi:MAG TPA: DUF2232 domain-containing protein [Pseudolabrys sp.]